MTHSSSYLRSEYRLVTNISYWASVRPLTLERAVAVSKNDYRRRTDWFMTVLKELRTWGRNNYGDGFVLGWQREPQETISAGIRSTNYEPWIGVYSTYEEYAVEIILSESQESRRPQGLDRSVIVNNPHSQI